MNTRTLIDYIKGALTPEERRAVAEWIESSEENKKEYRTLRRLYDLIIWNPARAGAVSARPRAWRTWALAAAVAAALVLGGLALRPALNRSAAPLAMNAITVPSGRELDLELADGSRVWLNAGSRLSFDPGAKDRRVYLEGEGYFSVAPDPDKPFVVETFGHDIQVVGTEFNVRACKEERLWEVALVKGSVRILTDSGQEVTTLAPGRRIALCGNGLLVSRLNENALLWKDGILAFDNLTLGEILQRLTDYYGVRFDTADLKTGDRRYTGKFRSQAGYEHILKSLRMIHHDFNYALPEGEGGDLPIRVY